MDLAKLMSFMNLFIPSADTDHKREILVTLFFHGVKVEFHACFQSSLRVITVPYNREHNQPGVEAWPVALWAADIRPSSIST